MNRYLHNNEKDRLKSYAHDTENPFYKRNIINIISALMKQYRKIEIKVI